MGSHDIWTGMVGNWQTQLQLQGIPGRTRMFEGQIGRMASVWHLPLPLCHQLQLSHAGNLPHRTLFFTKFFAHDTKARHWSSAVYATTIETNQLSRELAAVENDGTDECGTVSRQQEKRLVADFVTTPVGLPNLMPKGNRSRANLLKQPEQSKPLERQWTEAQYRRSNGQAGWDEAISKYSKESEGHIIDRAELQSDAQPVPDSSEVDDGWFLKDGQPAACHGGTSKFSKKSEGHIIGRGENHSYEQPVPGCSESDQGWFLTDGQPVVEGTRTEELQTSDTGTTKSQKEGSADLDDVVEVPLLPLSGAESSGGNKPRAKYIKARPKKCVPTVLGGDPPVAAAPSESKGVQFTNKEVLIVDNVGIARNVVRLLRGKYKALTHACDTEVSRIDVKKETPIGHGKIICFSIYCGPKADFGDGKSRLWVDVLDDGDELLSIFKDYFEDPEVRKVWHNYSFDYHILCNHGIKPAGFYADTMHLARLFDSSRNGEKGGYSLEALTSDESVMDGSKHHLTKEDAQKTLQLVPSVKKVLEQIQTSIGTCGKVSMKDMFGKSNVKKDGTPGKLKVIPPVEELQTGPDREKWIHYSSFDAVCTWKLWYSLWDKLKYVDCDPDPLLPGPITMYDFYDRYWQPFGQLLVQMECDGMLVDGNYLKEIEKTARNQQRIAESRFRKWAATRCPDAAYMNVGSDSQIRQLLFGGTSMSSGEVLPRERVFNIPNVEGYIEEGKKIAKKTRPITLRWLGATLPCDTYTASGSPTVSGSFLRSLAGKVAVDYSTFDDEADEIVLDGSDSTSTSPSEGETGEDVSMYGKAYKAFGGGEAGKDACMAFSALCEVAAINTLLSNFIEPLQGKEVKGPDGRVHCSLNINTETGRLSARRPSLQNQPALEKDRYKIRQAFIASPGNSLVVADYGQLELRLLAHLARCESMRLAFEAGGDFHSRTAMNMYTHVRNAVESGEVLLEWEPQPGLEKPPVPLLKDKFSSERRKAKMLNFSIAYGKTALGLSKDWQVSIDEAEATLNLWYADRKEVRAWQDARRAEAENSLCVHTLLGRTRNLPDAASKNKFLKSHSLRAAINTPVQGSAADVAMCAMLEINQNQELRKLGWRLLLQVHDEVILEGPTESAERARELVVHSMSYPFNGKNPLSVALAVDAKYAQSWYAAK